MINTIMSILIQTEGMPELPVPDVTGEGEKAFSMFKGLSLDDAISKMANSMVDFAFKLAIAILVFYLGKLVIRKIFKFTRTILINRHIDASLTTFVLSLINIVLYFILIITVIGIIGIETSSFLALFASAGVAIGMALSGTLQNFAGGVLILLLKPYKVGDFIETQGYTGTVKAIQIFHTVINTIDNKAIIIPNGGLSTGSINNYSLERYRRVDWTIALSYGDDFEKAKEVILKMLAEDSRVVEKYTEDYEQKRLEESVANCDGSNGDETVSADVERKKGWFGRMRERRKARMDEYNSRMHNQEVLNAGLPVKIDRSPFVGLNELGDNSINIVVRAWTDSANYWSLYFDMNQRFYAELPQHDFSFPFPQLDVHLDSAK